MASAIVRSHRIPFVSNDLIRKLKRINMKGEKEVIKTWSRGSTITPEMIGIKISIHNGKNFKRLNVIDRMVGHKLGEFALTRKRRPHAKLIADASKKKGKGKGRSFSTCARYFDDKNEIRSIEINCGDGYDPFTASKGLCQVVNLIDQNPLVVASSRMRVDVHGIEKEGMKVLVDRNTLIIKQEVSKDEESEWRLSGWVNFSQKFYSIRTEMKKVLGFVHVRGLCF